MLVGPLAVYHRGSGSAATAQALARDAAVTCIEKDRVPGRRDVRRIVEIMMGGDRIGRVGYDALPPLARDVHKRFAPLRLRLEQRGVRAGHGAAARSVIPAVGPPT